MCDRFFPEIYFTNQDYSVFVGKLVELQPLVGLSADHRRVRQVAPITHMPEDRTSAGCARARGFVALSSIPLMAYVDPGEPDPLFLLGGAGRRGVLLGGLGRLRLLLGPCPVEGGPVCGQLTRCEKS